MYLPLLQLNEKYKPCSKVLGRVSDTRGRHFSLCELDIPTKTDDSFLLWYKISPHRIVLKTTRNLQMWLHFRNSRFLYHTDEKMTHELEHIVWAGARWGRGKNAKHQAAVVSYCILVSKWDCSWLSFVTSGLCTCRLVTANYKMWSVNNVENHSGTVLLGLHNSCRVSSSFTPGATDRLTEDRHFTENSRCFSLFKGLAQHHRRTELLKLQPLLSLNSGLTFI